MPKQKEEPEEQLVPEIPVTLDSLEETVRVIKTGLFHHPIVSEGTKALLLKWCNDRDEEIHSREHIGEPNPFSDENEASQDDDGWSGEEDRFIEAPSLEPVGEEGSA